MEAPVLMLNRMIIILLILLLSVFSKSVSAKEMKPGEFLVLCYHAVPFQASPGDSFSVPQEKFVEQMEYLRTHGYHPVSLDDILGAREDKKRLPDKPVLLTFDDAYISYYEFVLPLLKELDYPSVLAVAGKFIYDPPKGMSEPLMSWEHIKEVGSHDLVEVISHSFDLHKGIRYNPQGNTGSAVSVRAYFMDKKAYETEKEYRRRIRIDFMKQKNLFRRKLGFAPRAIVWPYGRYNSISMETARKSGAGVMFGLKHGFAHINELNEVKRNLVENASIEDFIKMVNDPDWYKPVIRAVQIDIDLIYDPESYEKTDQNLGRLIDRLVEMKVNTVFLKAFADLEGTGSVKSVYFPNRALPVQADILSHAVHQIMIRDMKVYAWMPTLSIELPDQELNGKLKVLELAGGKPATADSKYKRLTPFSDDVISVVQTLYEDLAVHTQVHGILFQDDAYLSDTEDFHPMALEAYKETFTHDMLSEDMDKNPELAKKWARYKTEVLINFTNELKKVVRKYRPNVYFARNLYAGVLEYPKSESKFAQDYELFLKNYDQVVVMAYSRMKKIRQRSKWLKKLVSNAKGFPDSIDKTVFKIQTYDWKKEVWIKDRVILEELRDILSSGGRHLAYYPDDFRVEKPGIQTIKLEMSTQSDPFLP
jgi:biofilm PGA synthesis lipoprotein PgaB